MSRVAEQAEKFVAAIKAKPGFAGWDVRRSSSTKAAFGSISRRKLVAVVYGGRSPFAEQLSGQRGRKQRIIDTWYVVLVAESYLSMEDAYAKAGGADAALDALDTLNGEDISDSAHVGKVFVRCDDVTLEEGETTPDGGGTVGYVGVFHSFTYEL